MLNKSVKLVFMFICMNFKVIWIKKVLILLFWFYNGIKKKVIYIFKIYFMYE